MLTIENVTKRFGEIVALDRVSLSLARGEFFGLLGPNGAGKTTLMSLVAGLRAPDSGSISISGQRVGPNAMAPRHELGFVPQAIALYEELSAEENLRLFGKLYGLAVFFFFFFFFFFFYCIASRFHSHAANSSDCLDRTVRARQR